MHSIVPRAPSLLSSRAKCMLVLGTASLWLVLTAYEVFTFTHCLFAHQYYNSKYVLIDLSAAIYSCGLREE